MHEVVETKVVYEGKYLQFLEAKVKGLENPWEYVERKNVYGPVVLIFAVTKNNEVILERNYRIPIRSYVYELPAGLMDIEGETEEDAARRELMEETGYIAGEFIKVYEGPHAPTVAVGNMAVFFAKDAEYAGPATPECGEDISVAKVPLEEIEEFLMHSRCEGIAPNLRILGLITCLRHDGYIPKL